MCRVLDVSPSGYYATAPNQVWVTDVTAYWTDDGWLYLAAIIDLFARRVVGWAVSEHNDTALALLALRRACFARPAPTEMFFAAPENELHSSHEVCRQV